MPDSPASTAATVAMFVNVSIVVAKSISRPSKVESNSKDNGLREIPNVCCLKQAYRRRSHIWRRTAYIEDRVFVS